MNKLRLIILLLLVSLASAANADQASHKRSVLTLLEVTNSRQLLDQMAMQVKDIIGKQIDSMDLAPEEQATVQVVKNEMLGWLSELLDWDAMKEMYVDIYMDVFTEDEINELIGFYQSPLGKKMLDKMPALAQTTLARTQDMVLKKMPEIQRRVENLKAELENRYKKEHPEK